MKKIRNILKWRLRLVQQGYDLGWKHGHEAGLVDGHYEIMDIIAKKVEPVDWLREYPLEVRDIIPLIKSETKHKAPSTW